MNLIPMLRKCPMCHRIFMWKPDVYGGVVRCPYCRKIMY